MIDQNSLAVVVMLTILLASGIAIGYAIAKTEDNPYGQPTHED